MFALFAATQARAQGTVWSAMLNAKDMDAFGFGCTNTFPSGANRCDAETTLTDDDFSVGNNSHTIDGVQLFSEGTLRLSFSVGTAATYQSSLNSLNFCVGATALAFSSSSASGGVNVRQWASTGFTWTAGTAVSLSISSTCTTQSTDATLSALTASSSTSASGTFTSLNIGTFASGTTSYTATVANSRTHVKLTPTVNDSNATVKVGKGSSLTTVTSGSASGAIPLSVGSNAITVEVTAEDGTTTQTYTVTVTRQTPPSTVSLSASPNPVREGTSVTVTATLSAALSSAVTIPVTVSTTTPNTAESGDVGTLNGITIAGNATTGTGTITANQDGDEDDETFTVALGSSLPSGVTAGSPSSVQIRISDDDKAFELSVDATPACGTTVADTSVTTTINLQLTPAPAAELATQYRWLTGTAQGEWTGNAPIRTTGRTGGVNFSPLADLRGAYPGFTGFEFRLQNTPGVTAQCTWNFGGDNGGGGGTGDGDSGGGDTGGGGGDTGGGGGGTGGGGGGGGTGGGGGGGTGGGGGGGLGGGGGGGVTRLAVSLSASPNPVDEGSAVTVTATLTAVLPADVTVPLSLSHGTAEDGDYGTLASITIDAGSTTGTGTVSTTDDADRDDETFTVALGTLPTAVTEGSPSSVEVTIRDTTAAQSRLFVPVVLQSPGRTGGSFFTSEMILTNRGPAAAAIGYTYNAAWGGGSGKAADSLGAGEQRVVADAIAHLRALGVPIGSGPAGGTLRVDFSNLSLASDAAVTLRVTTPVEEGGGRAGLSYYGLDPAGLLTGPAFITGLRRNERDRSNLAIQNAGVSGGITLRVTVFSGDPAAPARSLVLPDRTLPPGGFHQYNGILDLAGFDNGYVKVEPVGGTAPFYCYGVINDNFNSDGAFVFPVPESSLVGRAGQTLPVLIESGNFRSELTVTNFSASGKTVDFRFVADAVDSSDDTARFSLTLEAGEQVILPDIVEQLRRRGVEGIGPAGRPFMGALFATPAEGDMSGIVIGARTGSPDGRGGQYSLFYDGVPYGSAFNETAWIYGLQQDAENRSNLALVNTGEIDDSSSTFELTVYDGSGATRPTIRSMTLGPGRWTQVNGILGGIGQGYVRVRKTSGNNPFFAYGVINDGGAPGERSGDGAYLPARE